MSTSELRVAGCTPWSHLLWRERHVGLHAVRADRQTPSGILSSGRGTGERVAGESEVVACTFRGCSRFLVGARRGYLTLPPGAPEQRTWLNFRHSRHIDGRA